MKKLSIIHQSGAIGGACISLLHIIRAIDRTKYNITVLCPYYPNEMIKLLQKEECQVVSSTTSPKIFGQLANIEGIPYEVSVRFDELALFLYFYLKHMNIIKIKSPKNLNHFIKYAGYIISV